MQRSNYSEPTGGAGAPGAADGEQDEDDELGGGAAGHVHGGRTTKGRARQQTISDKRQWDRPGLARKGAAGAKKASMAVRSAILYKKNLSVLLEESVRGPLRRLSVSVIVDSKEG